jgi:hypothetical protein
MNLVFFPAGWCFDFGFVRILDRFF